MAPADFEGCAGSSSVVPASRWRDPVASYVVENGSYQVAGYIVRISCPEGIGFPLGHVVRMRHKACWVIHCTPGLLSLVMLTWNAH